MVIHRMKKKKKNLKNSNTLKQTFILIISSKLFLIIALQNKVKFFVKGKKVDENYFLYNHLKYKHAFTLKQIALNFI